MSGISQSTQLARQFESTRIIKLLNAQLQDQTNQLSTGLKSDGLVGVASQAYELGGLKSQKATVAAYSSAAQTALNRVTLQANSIQTVIDRATDALDMMIKNRDATFAATSSPAALANSLLDQIGLALQVKDGDRYIFSGTNYTDNPLSGNLSSIPTTYAAGTTPGVTAGYDDPLGVAVDATSTPQPPYLNASAAAQANFYDASSIRIFVDDNEPVTYGVSVTDSGIQRVIDAVVRFRDATADIQTNPDNYQVRVDDALKQLRSAITELKNAASANGYNQQHLTEVIDRHASTADLLTKRIGNIQDADTAQVSVNINALQTSLEATYSVISNRFSLSLVNYLK